MSELFPDPVKNLPQADIPLQGITAYLSQADSHQIIFMEFDEDVELPEHSHENQWGVVLEGRIYAGYADMTFFDQPDRYKIREPNE